MMAGWKFVNKLKDIEKKRIIKQSTAWECLVCLLQMQTSEKVNQDKQACKG